MYTISDFTIKEYITNTKIITILFVADNANGSIPRRPDELLQNFGEVHFFPRSLLNCLKFYRCHQIAQEM